MVHTNVLVVGKSLRLILLLGMVWTGVSALETSVKQLCDIQGLTAERIITQAQGIQLKEDSIKKKRLLMIVGATALVGAAVYSFLTDKSEGRNADTRSDRGYHYAWYLHQSDLSFKEELLRGIRNGCTFGFYSAVGGIAYCVASEGYGSLAKNIKECFFDYRDDELAFFYRAFNERCAFFRSKISSCLKRDNEKGVIIDSAYSLVFACDECLLELAQLIAFCQYYTSEDDSKWGAHDLFLYTPQLDDYAQQLQSETNELAQQCCQGDVTVEANIIGQQCLRKLQGVQEFVAQKVREYRRNVHGVQVL